MALGCGASRRAGAVTGSHRAGQGHAGAGDCLAPRRRSATSQARPTKPADMHPTRARRPPTTRPGDLISRPAIITVGKVYKSIVGVGSADTASRHCDQV